MNSIFAHILPCTSARRHRRAGLKPPMLAAVPETEHDTLEDNNNNNNNNNNNDNNKFDNAPTLLKRENRIL